jgi:hypothetical protein
MSRPDSENGQIRAGRQPPRALACPIPSAVSHRLPRPLLHPGEAMALLGVRPDGASTFRDQNGLQPVRSAQTEGQQLFDRHDVEAQLTARMAGDELDRARRLLLRVVYGEVSYRTATRQFSATGVAPAPTSHLLDEELYDLVAEAAGIDEDLSSERYDTHAVAEGLPCAYDLQLRLAEWSWPRLVTRARRRAQATA